MGYRHDPELWRLWTLIAQRGRDLDEVLVLDDPAPGPRDRGHLHHVPTLLVPLRGVVRIEARTRRIDLHPGQALLTAPATWHEHHPLRAEAAALYQGFMARWSDVHLLRPGMMIGGAAAREPYHRHYRELLSTEATAPQRLAGIRVAVARLVEEPIAELRRPHPAVQRMCHQLWWRFTDGIGAAEIIAAAGCSPAQAYRLFDDFFGRPPKQELEAMRLETARHLLARGWSVGAAASRVGFGDRRAFTRACRRRYECTPRELRTRP